MLHSPEVSSFRPGTRQAGECRDSNNPCSPLRSSLSAAPRRANNVRVRRSLHKFIEEQFCLTNPILKNGYGPTCNRRLNQIVRVMYWDYARSPSLVAHLAPSILISVGVEISNGRYVPKNSYV